MKSCILIFILFMFMVSYKTFGELPKVIELSQRVGTEITQTEKNYFGLFPTVSGFISAKLLEDKTKGLYFSIQTSEGQQVITVNDKNIQELRKVIENFEKIINKRNSNNFDIDVNLIRDLLKVNTIYYSDVDKINIKLINGEELTGHLIYFDEFRIYIYQSDKEFDNRCIEEGSKIIPFYEIYSIKEAEYSVFNGNQYLYIENRKSLTDLTVFRDKDDNLQPPPEVLDVLNKDTIINTIQDRTYEPLMDELYQNHFFVSASYNYLFNGLKDIPIHYYLNNDLLKDFVIIKNLIYYNVELGYKLMNYLYFSLNYVWGEIYFHSTDKPVHIVWKNYNDDIHNYNQIGLKTIFNMLKSSDYYFEYNQFLLNSFLELGIVKFDKSYLSKKFSVQSNEFDYINIANNYLYSLTVGMTLQYDLNRHNYIYISGYCNIIRADGSFVVFGQTRTNYCIGYIYNYGLNIGLGIEY